MKTLLASVCAAALLAFSPPATASLISFHADLNDLQETPPTGSPATGSATLTADTVAQTLTVNETFTGLLGTTTAGHLHAGAPGVAGPVAIPFNAFPLGVTSGSFNGTFAAADLINQAMTGISTFADLLNALEAGDTYLNIHSTLFSTGEIRGQVRPAIPEPMALTLLGVGLVGLAGAKRWCA